jgi:hypothetical protein
MPAQYMQAWCSRRLLPDFFRSAFEQIRQRHAKASAARRTHHNASKSPNRWSHHGMETSDAMYLDTGIFKTGSALEIAQSLRRSSTQRHRRIGTPFQSAMSMLNFYIDRAGSNLPWSRRDVLERTKR